MREELACGYLAEDAGAGVRITIHKISTGEQRNAECREEV
jgi:hypothetical protein